MTEQQYRDGWNAAVYKAQEELVRQDQFSERTLHILDGLIERPVPTTDEPDHHLYRAVRLADGLVAGPWMPGERAQISDQTEWREEMSSDQGWIAVAPVQTSLPTREQIAEAVKRAVLDTSFLSERDANGVWRRVQLAMDALLQKGADR